MIKKIKKQNNVGKKVAIGAGVAALTVAAYLLLGPDGKKNRKKVKGWTEEMKRDVVTKFKKMKHITEPIYHKVVDEVSAKYAKAKNVSKEEVAEAVADLKKHWKVISTKTKATKKPAKSGAKKAVSKVKSKAKK